MQRNNEHRIQQTYKQLVEAERTQMESEYRQKSDEIKQKRKSQLKAEKLKLQKVNSLCLKNNVLYLNFAKGI